MSTAWAKHDEMRSLMEEAYRQCVKLQNYSDENFQVFLSDNDDAMIDVINSREKIIESLINIEYQIDMILEEVDEYGLGGSLPPDIDEIRSSIRTVLSSVSGKDMEMMKIISGRMQMYKIETLKARNKKNLSAYMRTVFVEPPGESVDFSE